MFYGYCRVSTVKQLEGNGLEAQQTEILSRYPNALMYSEQFTGTKTTRPAFSMLLDRLEPGDTLIVSKLDRLARNTVEGINVIESLFKKGVAVHVLNVGLLENTTTGRFFITTLLAVAEMERNMILERTQAGKEIARLDPNYTEGRPTVHDPDKIADALEMLTHSTYEQIAEITGISKSTLIRANKNKRNYIKRK